MSVEIAAEILSVATPADCRHEKKFEITFENTFDIVFEIAGRVPVKNFLLTKQGFKCFGDVSGRFSNFSFHFWLWN